MNNQRCYVSVNGMDVEIVKRENGRFFARYYPRRGERRRVSLDTKNLLTAKAAVQKAIEMDLAGGNGPAKNSKLTFEEFKEVFFLENPERYRSLEKIRSALNVICRSEIGKLALRDICKRDILSYIKSLSDDGKSLHSLNKAINILKAVLEYARKEKYISENPVTGIKKYQVFPRERYLKIEELEPLLNACPQYLREMIIITLHLGLRKGELLNLKWGNVDFANGIVMLEKTKSGSTRCVQLTDRVNNILKARYQQKKRSYEDFVYETIRGKAKVDILVAFKYFTKKAGITNIRWHDLRRTYAVYYAQATGDLNSLRANLGHSRLEVTQHYLPISLEQQRAGAQKFESYLMLKAGEEKACHKFDTTAVSGEVVKV